MRIPANANNLWPFRLEISSNSPYVGNCKKPRSKNAEGRSIWKKLPMNAQGKTQNDGFDPEFVYAKRKQAINPKIGVSITPRVKSGKLFRIIN